MRISGILILSVSVCLFGCGGKEAENRVSGSAPAVLPQALRPLQGAWTAETGGGRLRVEGRTMRLVFTHAETGQLYRRNVFIERADAAAHELEMRGESRPWHYSVSRSRDGESIMFRFYDEESRGWVGSVMTRSEDQFAVR